MKFAKVLGLVAALAVAVPLNAEQVIDSVTVVGQRTAPTTDGSRVLCHGESCAYLIMMMQMESNLEWLTAGGEIVDEPPINRQQFCRNLSAGKPETCAVNRPAPSTPRYDVNWQPNGCGDRSLGSSAANFIAANLPTGGTGLDNPAHGINFRSACNAHDYCYGMGSGQAFCDTQFATDLNNICATTSTAGCGVFADLYVGAVRQRGHEAYALSVAQDQCAIWKKDMEANQCPYTGS